MGSTKFYAVELCEMWEILNKDMKKYLCPGDIHPLLSLSIMRIKYSKEVDRLILNIKRLENDPAFAEENEKLSEFEVPFL